MVINKITVHAIIKEQHQDPLDNEIRADLIDPTHQDAAKLLEAVTKLYGSQAGAASFGIFADPDRGGNFPTPAREYILEEDPSNEQFQALTVVAMNELRRQAAQKPTSTGGYMLFADYSIAAGRFLVVVMFKQKPSFRIQNLSPEELLTLDTSRIHQAARVSFSKFHDYENSADDNKHQLRYLSFVSPLQQRPAAGYFVEALGCVVGASSRETTQALIKESVAYLNSVEELKQYAHPFRDSLMDYLNEKVERNEPVTLTGVGEVYRQTLPIDWAEEADDLVNQLITKLNSDDVGVPDEFLPNKTVVLRNTRIKAQGTGWRVEFDRQKLGDQPAASVYYDRQTRAITLRGLPDKMISDIEETLGNPDNRG